MSSPPFMPLYVGDYLGDTAHLTCTEHGAYMLLLMAMWRAGGSLPNDDVRLARFCRCTRQQWDRMRPNIMPFFTASDAEIKQDRLTAELMKYTYAVERQRVRSSNGGKAKALKNNKSKLPAATPRQCQPEPEPEYKGKPLQGLTLIRREEEISPLDGQSLPSPQIESLDTRKALADEARQMLGMMKGRKA